MACKSFFLDARTLTTSFTQIEQTGTTHAAYFVQHHAVNMRAHGRKCTLNTHTIAYFANGKGGGRSIALALDYITTKALDTGFGTLNYAVVYSYIIAGFKIGQFFCRGHLFVYKFQRLLVHGSNFLDGKGK